MVIEVPPPTDLQVESITVPTDGRAGEPIRVEWTVRNKSLVSASGSWDRRRIPVGDATWDINDRPLGRAAYTGTLNPDGTYTLSLNAIMPGATPGEYRIIVRTDILNQVHEDVGEANNKTASDSAITVAVDELTIGIPLTVNLNAEAGQERPLQGLVPAGPGTMRLRLRLQRTLHPREVTRSSSPPSMPVRDLRRVRRPPLHTGSLRQQPPRRSYRTRARRLITYWWRGFSGPPEGAGGTRSPRSLTDSSARGIHTDTRPHLRRRQPRMSPQPSAR
jgi:hypothetical protein